MHQSCALSHADDTSTVTGHPVSRIEANSLIVDRKVKPQPEKPGIFSCPIPMDTLSICVDEL